MKKIMLSQGLEALVDDEDFEFLNQYKWTASVNGKYQKRAIRAFNYFKDGKAKHKTILMHRIIMLSPPEEFEIDHVDGDSLNNQKSNLRLCSHSQNMRNRRQKTQTSSKYKGVSFSKKYNNWVANLQFNNKQVLNKHFKTEEEAALAYNETSKKYHGEFACLNKIIR